MVAIEMCMTGLQSEKAAVFFKNSAFGNASSSATEMMSSVSGISHIIPEMEICDFEFDPCGYSMNGIHGKALSTIHVTPEDGFSYASYEAMGFQPSMISYSNLIERVLSCFEPAKFSVAVTIFGGRPSAFSFGQNLDVRGYKCEDHVEQDLPGDGLLLYQSFSVSIMDVSISPRSILHCPEASEDVDEKKKKKKKKSMKKIEF